MPRDPRSQRSSPAGSKVVDVEWRPVEETSPEGSPADSASPAQSPPIVATAMRAVAVKTRAPATASGQCPVCGGKKEMVTVPMMGGFLEARVCRRCAIIGQGILALGRFLMR